MMITLLVVAGVAVVYAGVMLGLLRRWRRAAPRVPTPPAVRTSIDHDPDGRYPFMSGDSL